MSFRPTIIHLHKKGMSPTAIARALMCNRMLVWRTLNRYKDRGDTKDHPRSGRPQIIGKKKVVKQVREKIRRNKRRSVRQLAREHSLSRSTMQRIIHTDLKMKSYVLQRRQLLTEDARKKRLERSKLLLAELRAGTQTGEIVYSDEKLFTVEPAHNRQNERLIGKARPDLSSSKNYLTRRQKPAAVMVWAAVSRSWKSPLIVLSCEEKINSKVYQQKVLEPFRQAAQQHYGTSSWTFQQDGATPHTSISTQRWCSDNLQRFWSKELWPPSSPDLNPMDFAVWSELEAMIPASKRRSKQALAKELKRAWNKIPNDRYRAAVDSVSKRLRSVISASGGHFE